MPVTWGSVGHFFAAGYHDLVVAARAVAAHNAQLQQAGSEVETATAAVGVVYPPALAALEIERVAMACFGAACGLIMTQGGAKQAAEAAPGADAALLAQVEQIMQQHPELRAQAAALFGEGK